MTSRERLLATINHTEPDRVCVDFGSTPVTGIHVLMVDRLRQHYGLDPHPVRVCEPYQMLGEVEDDLRDCLGIDTIGMTSPGNIFGFRNENWQPWTTPWGQDVLVPGDFQTTTDTNGDTLIFPQGDRTAPPSGRMPTTGYFFDAIIRQPPIDEEALNPDDNLEEFALLTQDDIAWYQTQADTLRHSHRGVVAGMPGTAFGDIALVPAPFLKHPKGIRDISEWYMSTAMRQDYVHAIFTKQCQLAIANLARVKQATGDTIDVAFICGTDFGTQTSQFCSAKAFDALYAPYYRQVNDWIHTHTRWKTFKHSCGAVRPLIDHFIAAGFDILNPVQCSATNMDPTELKQEYGSRLVFWGGGVDTQKTLPFGTPDEVYREVRQRLDIFASGGGFVFDAIHNVQANTPVENVAAMFQALSDAR